MHDVQPTMLNSTWQFIDWLDVSWMKCQLLSIHDGFYWLILGYMGHDFCDDFVVLAASSQRVSVIILVANHERSILLVRSDCNHQTVEASSNAPPETSTIGWLFVCLIALWLITFAWLFGFGCYGALWVIRIHDKSCIKQPALRLSSVNKNVLLDRMNWNVGIRIQGSMMVDDMESLFVKPCKSELSYRFSTLRLCFRPSESSWSWGSKPVRSRHRLRLRSGCPVTLKGKVLGVQASFGSLEFQEATA